MAGQEEVDDIHRILNGGVVQYYHRNDALFRPSRVEAESLRVAQVCGVDLFLASLP